MAISAPLDARQKVLTLYTLRYEEESRDTKTALRGIKGSSLDPDELDLAKRLIKKGIATFNLSAYKDDYEAAMKTRCGQVQR